MRLSILDDGHGIGKKALFAFIRLVSRQPTPEPLKLVSYRPGFYGDAMKKITHEAMRGPSPWSVADRELMAAVVSQANTSAYCVAAHTAISTLAYGDGAKVSAALADGGASAVAAPLGATLQMLRTLTRDRRVEARDVQVVLGAGGTRQHVIDALAVAYAFAITNRLADAFAFELPSKSALDAGAKYLLSHGYR